MSDDDANQNGNKNAEVFSSRKTENDEVFLEHKPDNTDRLSVHSNASSSSSKKKNQPPNIKTAAVLVILLLVYIGFNFLGAYIFIQIEHRPEEGTKHWFIEAKQEFLKNHSDCITRKDLDEFLKLVEQTAFEDNAHPLVGNTTRYPHVWTFHNAFTLSFTIASTIGYGLVVPSTANGQIFCIIYALLSIPFTGLMAAKLGSFVAYFIKRAALKLFGHFTQAKMVTVLLTFLLGLLIYIVIPTIVLLYVDNNEQWTFIECLYCIFITLTTIGFGDYVPNPSSAGGIYVSVFVLIYVVAGLAWLATIINLLATAMKQQATTLKKQVLKNQINFRKSLKVIRFKLGKRKGFYGGNEEASRETQLSSLSERIKELNEKEKFSPKYSPRKVSFQDEQRKRSISSSEIQPEDGDKEQQDADENPISVGHSGLLSVVLSNINDYEEE